MSQYFLRHNSQPASVFSFFPFLYVLNIAVWLISPLSVSLGKFHIQAHWEFLWLLSSFSYFNSVPFNFSHFCLLACGNSSLASVDSCQESDNDWSHSSMGCTTLRDRGSLLNLHNKVLITHSDCNCYQEADFAVDKCLWRYKLRKHTVPSVLPSTLTWLLPKQTLRPVHAVSKADKVQPCVWAQFAKNDDSNMNLQIFQL